jgi:hypothetical protein
MANRAGAATLIRTAKGEVAEIGDFKFPVPQQSRLTFRRAEVGASMFEAEMQS